MPLLHLDKTPPNPLPRTDIRMPDLQSLEDYIRSDEANLQRQREILDECDPATPAHALAKATVAAYEQSLKLLRRRRAAMIARRADARPGPIEPS